MADSTIEDLPTIGSVDRSADKLPIWDASTSSTGEATINATLGISGNPVGTSDSQTLTNKTLTSPAISNPAVSGTVTGTYTLGGTPTFPSTVVSTTGTQTLTNKTLTSPTLNNATISNPTLTVNTVSEYTLANGVTIDGLNIKDGALNTNNSVVTANITDGAITNAKLSTTAGEPGGAWQSWTPTFTNVTVGNGTVAGKKLQIGKTVIFNARFTFGSTSSITGVIACSLPVTSVNYTTAYSKLIGYVSVYDASPATQFFGVAAWTSTTGFEPDVQVVSTYVKASGITSSIPINWATGDVLDIHGFYEAA